MPDVRQIIVHLSRTAVTYGFYTLADGLLTMTHDDGQPVDINGMTFTHHMRPTDNPDSIAAVLTKKIRTSMIGDRIEGFSNELQYPRVGVA